MQILFCLPLRTSKNREKLYSFPHCIFAHLLISIMTWQKDEYTISTDKTKLDAEYLHRYLCFQSYWAKGIPFQTVKKSIEGSLCFGIYKGPQMTGFARVITDGATFAYLADVFVDEKFRGLGLSKWLMEVFLNHPDLQGLR